MKRYRALLCGVLCALLLCACGSPVSPGGTGQSEPERTDTPPESPSLSPSPDPSPSGSGEVPPSQPSERPVPLGIAIPIYEGPGYDFAEVCAVGEDGVYTIVEEQEDYEGNLWGRLKSGLGWVDLTYALDPARESEALAVGIAPAQLISSGSFLGYSVDGTEQTKLVAFWAREPLTQVTLTMLTWEEDTFVAYQTLYTPDVLTPDLPMVAELAFWGSGTVYGLTYTDADGQVHHLALSESGRNGSLVVREYTP